MAAAGNNEVGNAFARALKGMLLKRKLSITDAAKQLGISRQALHSCLKGKLPRRKTLNKAMHIWDLKLDLGKHSFDKAAFTSVQSDQVRMPLQRSLWEVLDSITDENLQITTKRVGKVLRVDVRIELPA